MTDLLNTFASAGPLQVVVAIAMILAGPALIAIAFRMGAGDTDTADAPAEDKPAAPAVDPILSQVGFVEVDGRVRPFRALVRQSESLDDQQIAAFRRNLATPSAAKFAA